jgi:hypothetical protein
VLNVGFGRIRITEFVPSVSVRAHDSCGSFIDPTPISGQAGLFFILDTYRNGCKPLFMKHIHPYTSVRLVVAMLVTVGVIVLSTLATHAPAQNQNWLTLKNIRTDNATSFYADNRENRAWFVEMVLPTGHYADNRAARAWFVEMVLPIGDSDVMTENLKSVAATL